MAIALDNDQKTLTLLIKISKVKSIKEYLTGSIIPLGIFNIFYLIGLPFLLIHVEHSLWISA